MSERREIAGLDLEHRGDEVHIMLPYDEPVGWETVVAPSVPIMPKQAGLALWEAAAPHREDGEGDADVEFIINSIAEFGVRVGDRFYFYYKRSSPLVYHENEEGEDPLQWRPVYPREFNEVIWPFRLENLSAFRVEGDDWRPLPLAQPPASDTEPKRINPADPWGLPLKVPERGKITTPEEMLSASDTEGSADEPTEDMVRMAWDGMSACCLRMRRIMGVREGDGIPIEDHVKAVIVERDAARDMVASIAAEARREFAQGEWEPPTPATQDISYYDGFTHGWNACVEVMRRRALAASPEETT